MFLRGFIKKNVRRTIIFGHFTTVWPPLRKVSITSCTMLCSQDYYAYNHIRIALNNMEDVPPDRFWWIWCSQIDLSNIARYFWVPNTSTILIPTSICNSLPANNVLLPLDNNTFSRSLHVSGALWLLCIINGPDRFFILIYPLHIPLMQSPCTPQT